jgi:hypothetical protein
MFNDKEFVTWSLFSNLFHLRLLDRYIKNIELSLLPKDHAVSSETTAINKELDTLGSQFIELAEGRLSQELLKVGALFTDYTIPLEERTEKLFGVDTNISLSLKEIKISPGTDNNPSTDLVNKIMELNKQALVIAKKFLEFATKIYKELKAGEFFIYSDLFLLNYMIDETKDYIETLDRLIDKQKVDPTYVSDFGYRNTEAMKDIAILVRSYMGASREDLFVKAESFVKEYNALLTRYKQSALDPDTQAELIAQGETLTNRFYLFIEGAVKDLLANKAYFIIEPIFLDTFLTHINYFKYWLKIDGANLKRTGDSNVWR